MKIKGPMDENYKFDPKNLLCGPCSGNDIESCPTHGKDYMYVFLKINTNDSSFNKSEYKCRFCCTLATFFCGNKAHFCTPCHDKAAQLVRRQFLYFASFVF